MGGGVMRSATKAALLGGYRSVPPRKAARPPAATARPAPSVGEPGLSVALLSSESGRSAGSPLVQGFQRPAIDEGWEFAEDLQDEIFDALHQTPRLVFGPVPTLEEAKQATSDLKDAIENVYYPAGEAADSSVVSFNGENSAILPQVPYHVAQALSLLQNSPEAQTVVASIASDKNVFDAIMKNEKVMEFFKAQESVLSPETNVDPEESVAENEDAEESFQSAENQDDSEHSVLLDWLHDVKLKVSKIVSNITDLFKDVIGTSEGTLAERAGTRTSTADSHEDYYTYGASLFALAVGTILIVLLKRGA